MAVEHIVWFRFKSDVTKERQAFHANALAAMKGKIAGVLDIKVGENFTDRAQGCQLGLIVTLESREDLDQYLIHPEHVKVAGPLKEDSDLVLAMDFETSV